MKSYQQKTMAVFAVAQAAIEYDQDVTPDVIYGSVNAKIIPLFQ